jgi:hypothetical protein
MKRLSNWLLLTLAVGCLALATNGCNRQASEQEASGTRVSLTELRNAFEDVQDKDVQAAVNDTLMSIRVGQYTATLAALDKLANYSSATSSQKKVTAKVISQVKALAAKNQAAAATPAPPR